MGEKSIVIHHVNELRQYRARILHNLDRGKEALERLSEQMEPLPFFQRLKFEKTVVDPITGEAENLIEVINQCQTYLVSVMAVEYLLSKHTGAVFKVNLGNVSGYDIEAEDGSVIAECFAATSYRSNRKLSADLKRLDENSTARYKYEFFYDMEFTNKHQKYYRGKYPDIQIVKFCHIE